MPKVRQDAWSHEDDLLLAETVLRHIREGSTQLKAFDEVGDVLNRTSAACGFRWNAEVRQKYEQAVSLAKKQRKEKKREEAMKQPSYSMSEPEYVTEQAFEQRPYEEEYAIQPQVAESKVNHDEELNLSQVIHFLKQLQKESGTRSQRQLQMLEDDNKRLSEENQQLTRRLETMTEDYQALIQIMDRARKMVMFDDQESAYKPQFRMERNGNLENIAR